ncbi:hypothetical protein JW948_16775 [bacterium]|nr:hypothetical protein [bacterium]
MKLYCIVIMLIGLSVLVFGGCLIFKNRGIEIQDLVEKEIHYQRVSLISKVRQSKAFHFTADTGENVKMNERIWNGRADSDTLKDTFEHTDHFTAWFIDEHSNDILGVKMEGLFLAPGPGLDFLRKDVCIPCMIGGFVFLTGLFHYIHIGKRN